MFVPFPATPRVVDCHFTLIPVRGIAWSRFCTWPVLLMTGSFCLSVSCASGS